MDRYEPLLDIYGHVQMELCREGEYVRYTDHLAALKEKDAEIAWLRDDVDLLKQSHEMKFVRHIEKHLTAKELPVCKICGKDICEIAKEDSDEKVQIVYS